MIYSNHLFSAVLRQPLGAVAVRLVDDDGGDPGVQALEGADAGQEAAAGSVIVDGAAHLGAHGLLRYVRMVDEALVQAAQEQ